jgi:NhaA family Na+:H+ antiporter
MGVAFILRKMKISSYWPYILGSGLIVWVGMYNAHLHPALSLIFIVPFLAYKPIKKQEPLMQKPNMLLDDFDHKIKPFVDFGLILFGIVNAGVIFTDVSNLTWIVLAALFLGKTFGVFLFGNLARLIGFPLPKGMHTKDLFVTGIVAAMGLTVALFIAGAAFMDPSLQGAAKMGALFSAGAVVIAFIAGRILKIERSKE